MTMLFDGKIFIVEKTDKIVEKIPSICNLTENYNCFKSKLFVTLNGRGFFFGMPLNGVATVISFCTVPVGLGI